MTEDGDGQHAARPGRADPVAWRAAGPGAVALSAGEVHVWRIDLALAPKRLAALTERLTPEERQRAEGFGTEALRARFVAARAALREILAGYLGCAPEEVGLAYGARGKPRLATPETSPPLGFNLSHCEDLALVAVAAGLELGVDLERIRPIPKAERLAARYFTPAERRALPGGDAASAEAPEAEAPDGRDRLAYSRAFLELWCCKEAYLKATAEALSRPLGSFEVAMGPPGTPPRLMQVDGDAAAVAGWSLTRIEGLAGHAAVLAAPAQGLRLRRWRYAAPG